MKNKTGKQKRQSNKPASSSSSSSSSSQQWWWEWVNPSLIRYQHSRIRPTFSGCGRTVMQTMEEIRRGETAVVDIPPIQVLTFPERHQKNPGSESATGRKSRGKRRNRRGDDDDDEHPTTDQHHESQVWYYTLNNRRLWIFKQCLREGLLPPQHDHDEPRIRVRVRRPKSDQEHRRYTVDNCALEASFLREPVPEATKHDHIKQNDTVDMGKEHHDQTQLLQQDAVDQCQQNLNDANNIGGKH